MYEFGFTSVRRHIEIPCVCIQCVAGWCAPSVLLDRSASTLRICWERLSISGLSEVLSCWFCQSGTYIYIYIFAFCQKWTQTSLDEPAVVSTPNSERARKSLWYSPHEDATLILGQEAGFCLHPTLIAANSLWGQKWAEHLWNGSENLHCHWDHFSFSSHWSHIFTFIGHWSHTFLF